MQFVSLLKPHVLSTLASMRHKGFEREARQSILILTFCLGLAFILYHGARYVVLELQRFSFLAYLPVSHILGLFLLILFFTLIVSNLAIALGRFYQSNDTDLLLSSPIPFTTVFFLRSLLVLASASWMPALFLIPVFVGVLGPYSLTLSTALSLLPLLFCFFVIPTCVSITLATVVLYLSPTNYVRYILLALSLGVACSVWHFHSAIESSSSSLVNAEGLIRMISVLSLHQVDWLPGNWIGRSIDALLAGDFSFASPESQLLFGTTGLSIAIAYSTFLALFDEALSRSNGSHAIVASNKRLSFRSFAQALPFSLQTRGIVAKEYQLLLRDTAQLVQIALLFILSSLYLYNLETLAYASQFSQKFNQNWSNFMAITTVAIGCFFTVAVATRIVFPSLSLEGRVISLLQSAPVPMEALLRIKFWLWFIPLSILSVSFFAFGGYAIRLAPLPHALVAIFGLLAAYTAVGTAIGLGAKFARFDWEYSTQLAASFGSVFYMLTTVGTIGLSGLILLPLTFQVNKLPQMTVRAYIVLGAAFILAWLPALLIVRLSRRAGLNELEFRRTR